MSVPNGCLLTSEQFGVLSRRLIFNKTAAEEEFRSCREWFLMELPAANRRNADGSLFTTEGCLWTMGHYVSKTRYKSCAVRNGRREKVPRVEQPKQRMLVVASKMVRDWMSERPPARLYAHYKFISWMTNRQRIVERALQWGERNTHYYPLGFEGNRRFRGETIRHFAGTIASYAREELERISHLEFQSSEHESPLIQRSLF